TAFAHVHRGVRGRGRGRGVQGSSHRRRHGCDAGRDGRSCALAAAEARAKKRRGDRDRTDAGAHSQDPDQGRRRREARRRGRGARGDEDAERHRHHRRGQGAEHLRQGRRGRRTQPAAARDRMISKPKLFKKILVANRGEIAIRVMRACRELGIATAAVYSDADRDAIHPRYADEALHIGGASPTESYLRLDRIVKAAEDCGAEAIHPGYGFLSEKPAFPDACVAAGIQFIGPPASAMRALGSKLAARQLAAANGVPVSVGSEAIGDGDAAVGDAAIGAVTAAGYVNAGTVEFMFSEGEFFFLEVNARLQVEHPITEAVTGIDLVKEQIRVAAGLELSFSQRDVRWTGHAIEMRINAEDPVRKFLPNPKRIHRWVAPAGPGVRVDSGFGPGSEVPPNYDSLVAKLIVHGADRAEAIARAGR